MKNEDLKDRLLQNKDVKALEAEELSRISGGAENTYNSIICPICHQEVSLAFEKCPFCKYPVIIQS
ncbi:MAG: hypothetical protein IJI45_01895 [Anaerolineaceae bacterium]|nr:hypothetical protein [Anaerolineaceae bacterium]